MPYEPRTVEGMVKAAVPVVSVVEFRCVVPDELVTSAETEAATIGAWVEESVTETVKVIVWPTNTKAVDV